MTEYIQINLIDIIENKGEPFAKEILSSFLCPQNIDIEDFLKKKAISFYERNGFKRFDKREIERSDKRLFKSDYFIRMLKYLG